jgi:adenosylhomocysteinase
MQKVVHKPELFEEGKKSYEWALKHMPALTTTISKLKNRQPLSGRKIGVCLHVTKETSVLVHGLQELGARVALAAANPLSTQDDIATFLSSEGINVFAKRGETRKEYFDAILDVLKTGPEILMDDGSDLHATFHSEKSISRLHVVGGTEETTTGAVRLRALERSGKLLYPVIVVNNAQTKFLFDNRYGTGQSTIDGILRATSLLIAGKTVVVCGYGWVGKGIAKRARGLDAHVIVTEVDPFRALEAHMDGFPVLPISRAAPLGDIFVTATGQTGVVRGEHIEEMKEGAILSNAGHFDVEIDVKYLKGNSVSKRLVRPNVEEYTLKDGKHVYLIGEGRITNLVAAEGHPPEVMMMSFSDQLLSVVYLVEHGKEMAKKLYDVPQEIDRQVALNALEGFGIQIDAPTKEQLKYAQSWEL